MVGRVLSFWVSATFSGAIYIYIKLWAAKICENESSVYVNFHLDLGYVRQDGIAKSLQQYFD